MHVEEGAVVLNGHGCGHRDVRIALDGSTTEVKEPTSISRYRGAWKDGTFEYQVEFVRASDNTTDRSIRMIRRSFRKTADGLLVSVVVDPPVVKFKQKKHEGGRESPSCCGGNIRSGSFRKFPGGI